MSDSLWEQASALVTDLSSESDPEILSDQLETLDAILTELQSREGDPDRLRTLVDAYNSALKRLQEHVEPHVDFHSLTVGELYAAHVGEHSHLIGDRSESVDVHVRIATSLEKSRGYLLEMEEASASVLSSLKQGTEHLGLAQDKARRTGMFYERFDVDSRSMLHGRRTVRCDREGLLWCAVLGIAILVLVIVLAVKI